MLPFGHLAVGYLCYSLLSRARGRVPEAWPAIALAVGTQFPDLVDKPLAWYTAVLPYGRTLAHTLLVAGPVALGCVLLARRYGPAPLAFAVGWLSHLAADGVGILLEGELFELRYLVWPLLGVPAQQHSGVTSFVAQLEVTALVLFEGVLLVAALVLWRHDGMPGLSVAWEVFRWNRG
ncbi:metal-dependent hydrolase [Natronomonas sp. EA1]|uniref:metal-dependent hydrolase n=1 Tax=Natronomonas sp. EA1 TaxID=3421655 RepID=UPI003EB94215